MSVQFNVYVPASSASLDEIASAVNEEIGDVTWSGRDTVGDFQRMDEEVHAAVQKLGPAARRALVRRYGAEGAGQKETTLEHSEVSVRLSAADTSRLLLELSAAVAEATGGVISDVNSGELFDLAEFRARFGLGAT